MRERLQITVLGAGAWGTALACHAAARHDVLLWARDADVIETIRVRRENVRGLPGLEVPQSVGATADFDAALAHAGCDNGLLVIATSVAGLRPVAKRLHAAHGGPAAARSASIGSTVPLVWLCKGIERDTEQLPHEVLRDELGDDVSGGVLSGPSFAQEVARGLPVALTVASVNDAVCRRAVGAFHHGAARIYRSDDVIGVELAGAIKNVLAIAAGISDGMALGHNARAALVSRGLAEMVRLGCALGARADTFMGLSGVGDLVLTCTGDLSRNRRVGLRLAAGEPLDAVLASLGHVAEGVPCARAAQRLARAHNVDMPIVDGVCAVLDGTLTPQAALAALVAREPRHEVNRT